MKREGKNSIRKLVVEVETSTAQSGFEIRNNARPFIDRFIVPAVEKYINALETELTGGVSAEIDKLVIDISGDRLGFSDNAWKVIVDDAVGKAFMKVSSGIAEAFVLQITQKENQGSPSIANLPYSETDETISGIRLISESARELRSLFYFLETGQRPWWAGNAHAFSELLQKEAIVELINNEPAVFRDAFGRMLFSEKATERLIGQFSDDLVETLLRCYRLPETMPQNQLFVHSAIFERIRLLHRTHHQRLALWKRLIRWVSDVETMKLPDELPGFFSVLPDDFRSELLKDQNKIKGYSKDFNELIRWISDLAGRPDSGHLPEVVEQQLRTWLKEREHSLSASRSEEAGPLPETGIREESPIDEKDSGTVRTDKKEEEMPPSAFQKQQNAFDNPASEREENKHRKSDAEQPTENIRSEADNGRKARETKLPEEGVLVDNAGLVLLHPFLPHFFRDIGLMDDRKQLTDRVFAAHIIHFIATGKERDFEHAMAFAKYLAGIPIGESIARNIAITTDVLQKTEMLFDALREHWESVRNTSTEGIRETFLIREGKIVVSGETTRLIMERKTVDILLESLGWSIGMVHLPWKKEILFVEW